MDFAEAKAVHDILLVKEPKSASHDSATCQYCLSDVAASTPEGRKEGHSMDPIYTQEQADSLIESAVSKALANAEEEKAKAVADAKSELVTETEALKAEVASLQEARDADQIALATEKQKIADLEGEVASRDEAVARLARRTERLEKVGEVAKFTDEYLDENADRWADMDEAQFASVLDAYKDMASHIKVTEKASEEDQIPEDTAMKNERVDTPKVSARSALFSYTLKGGSN